MGHPVMPAVDAAGASDAALDIILTSFDTAYTWDYGDTRQTLHDLYEKAKRDQWNAPPSSTGRPPSTQRARSSRRA